MTRNTFNLGKLRITRHPVCPVAPEALAPTARIREVGASCMRFA